MERGDGGGTWLKEKKKRGESVKQWFGIKKGGSGSWRNGKLFFSLLCCVVPLLSRKRINANSTEKTRIPSTKQITCLLSKTKATQTISSIPPILTHTTHIMLSSPESRSPSPEQPIQKKLSNHRRSKGTTTPPLIPSLSHSGYGKGYVGGTSHYSEHAFKRHVDGKLDILILNDKDAKHVHVLKGMVEKKISNASGSHVTYQHKKKLLMIVGNEDARARARDYTRILLKLASGGHVKLDITRVRERFDVFIISLLLFLFYSQYIYY